MIGRLNRPLITLQMDGSSGLDGLVHRPPIALQMDGSSGLDGPVHRPPIALQIDRSIWLRSTGRSGLDRPVDLA